MYIPIHPYYRFQFIIHYIYQYSSRLLQCLCITSIPGYIFNIFSNPDPNSYITLSNFLIHGIIAFSNHFNLNLITPKNNPNSKPFILSPGNPSQNAVHSLLTQRTEPTPNHHFLLHLFIFGFFCKPDSLQNILFSKQEPFD